MDMTGRKITKIAREVGKFTVQNMRREGVGAAEFDIVHLVRHNPGITQTQVVQALNMDKGAAAKRVASLENKGYLIRRPNPADGRSQLLFATPQAEGLRNAKAETESAFYDYLMDGLSESDRETFLNLLDVVYRRSKAESRAGFPHLKDVLKGKTNEPKA